MDNGKQTTSVEHIYREKTDKRILRKNPWKDYRLHITVLILVIIAEMIGTVKIPITKDVAITIMPLIYTIVLGLIFYLAKPIKWIKRKQARIAEGAMMLFIGVLIAKLAVSSGQSIGLIFDMGPALILQELGHLATILVLPIALLLGFKKEAIGMTNSIGREPNVAVVVDKFGFNSPEARGVFAIFIIGTVIGTIFISFLVTFSLSFLPLHPYAFAMASGVGSASMNAAALTPLLYMFPNMATTLTAFAGFSNVLSFCLGVYMCIFIALPLTEFLYKKLEPKIGRNVKSLSKANDDESKDDDSSKHKKPKVGVSRRRMGYWTLLLAIFSAITVVINYIGCDMPIFESLVGMLILSLITFVGLFLERTIKLDISNIIYISLIGLVLALPFMPTSEFIVNFVGKVDLISICTVFLAYVGIGIGREWDDFKKIGWRGIIVTIFVISGTYLCSASLAQFFLVITNSI